MKIARWCQILPVAMATFQIVLPLNQLTAADAVRTSEVRIPANLKIPDLALGANGSLTGQAVDAQGNAKAKYAIRIEQNGRKVGETTTDAKGNFEVANVGAGVCQVVTADATYVCRCWTLEAAPPAAKGQLLVVSQEGLERGQRPIGEIITNPLFIGGVIAAAIAIPIAVHNSNNKKSGS